MTLARRTVLSAAALAIVAAVLVTLAMSRARARDRARVLDRVSAAFLTELSRETCEADAQWFLAGPRVGRPRLQDRQIPDADVKLPRPSAEALPFEFFAYDDQFLGSSVAAPRFPDEIKRRMRPPAPERMVAGRYESDWGTGQQVARWTGWTGGPCAVLLFRLAPEPGGWWTVIATAGLVFLGAMLIALAPAMPIVRRIRRLADAARESARQNYSGMAPATGRDEIGSLGAIFNDTAADIRQRIVDAQDREEALRRYVANTTEDVAEPMAALETAIADLAHRGAGGTETRSAARAAALEAHRLAMRLQNLAAVAHLRNITDSTPREAVDLSAVVAGVVNGRAALAESAGVTIAPPVIDSPIVIDADGPLVERAVANLVDNAIVHAGEGARVLVELRSYEQGRRFSLRVSDSGRGVTDEEFAGLTANKRFRGDEAKTRRPGGRGLGLALTREVADRFGLSLDLRRPTSGGFEAEIAPKRS